MNVMELLSQDPEKAVQLAEDAVRSSPNDVETLETLAEIYFETGNAERAFEVLNQCLELDPNGEICGFQKFLWLGQLLGGRSGLSYFEKGIIGLQKDVEANKLAIISGYLGVIEIYMTDLCMEPEAEERCETLVQEAIKLDQSHAEAWSILGSVRISQQREEDAKQALLKSLELYDSQWETISTLHVPQLLRLGQSLLEMELFEEAQDLTAHLSRVDDQIADIYYLNALAHHGALKLATTPDETNRHNASVRDAIELMQQLDEVDEEMKQVGLDLVASLPELGVEVADSDEESYTSS